MSPNTRGFSWNLRTGLAREPKAQKLLHSSFQLVDENTEVSGERVTKLKQFITKRYLVKLSGYGNVVLRSEKEAFEAAAKALEKYVKRFQRQVKKKLQAAIDNNRKVLAAALLPSVEANPPVRWRKFLGTSPDRSEMARMLDHELQEAFGSVDELIADMKVQKVFKGVTYESLCDPEFRRVALEAIPSLAELHEEYDAAKGQGEDQQPSQ